MKAAMRNMILHPFVIAVYPVLALLAVNIDQIDLAAGVRPLIATLCMTICLYLGINMLTRSSMKAGMITSAILIFVFSYGHLYDGLKAIGIINLSLIRHRYLLPIVIVALAFSIWMINRLRDLRSITMVFNIMSIALITLPLTKIIAFEVEFHISKQAGDYDDAPCGLKLPQGTSAPDIYLIVLDAYERDDVLQALHGYDNTPFLSWLESRGFYVARGSLSNYRHTEMALSSLLNLNYIQAIPESYSPDSENRMGLVRLILDSRVRRELECIGYHSVSIDPGIFWTRWADADFYIRMHTGILENLQMLGGITRFEGLLIKTSIGRAVVDMAAIIQDSDGPMIRTSSGLREEILFAFERLGEVPALPSPKIVFVHILSPHPPMIFGRNGEIVEKATFETSSPQADQSSLLLQAYADQVHYVNTRVQEVVTKILESSPTDPVIIIMGDHGWADRNPEDKLSILNAYHLPGKGNLRLYPTITPVNTFRLIFDEYFEGHFELLEDISYFSVESSVYDFEVISNTWSPDK